MRRRVRELFRAGHADFRKCAWIVVIAKNGSAEAGFSELREEWLRLMRRLSMVSGSE
jgi:ribonuclease P protein component